MNEHYGEQSIDILDMLKRLLKKWKLILLAGISCAVIVGLLFAFKSYSNMTAVSNYAAQLSGSKPYYSYSAAEIAKGLSLEEIEDAETAYSQYETYRNEIKLTKEYINNSLYLNLSQEFVPVVTLSYFIDVKDVEADGLQLNVNSIRSAYISALQSDDIIRDIISNCSLDTEPWYFNELVKFGPDSDALNGSTSASCLFSIAVSGNSKEECLAITKVYKSSIENLTPKINEALGSLDFSLQLVGETYSETDGKQIAEMQSMQYDRITEVKNKISAMESKLDSSVKVLYEQFKSAHATIDEGNKEQISELSSPTVSLVSKKAIVIGFVVGVFLMCVFLCFKYITGNRIRVKSDICEMFGLIDCVDEANIRSILIHKNYKNITVLGAAKNELSIGNSVIGEADAVVLAEKIDVSRTDDIRHEIDICRQHGIPIVGYIVFE